MIIHPGPLLLEHADHVESGTLPHIVDVLFVRNAENKNPASVYGLSIGVQCQRNAFDDQYRHLAVDLARKVDEASLVVQRAHLPREIVWIERNAVPANSRPWCKLHEAEGLRCGSVDYFPDIHAKLVANDLHLVDEADVH